MHPTSLFEHLTLPCPPKERECIQTSTRSPPQKSRLIPPPSAQADSALQLYYGQLALNMLWTPLFFGGMCWIYRILVTMLSALKHSQAEGDCTW